MPRLPSAEDLAGNRPSLRVAGGFAAARPTADIPSLGGEAQGEAELGKGLAGAAEKVAGVAEKDRERQDTLRVEDSFNQLRASQLDLTLGEENGFSKLRGADAAADPNRILKDWTAKFDDQTRRLEQSLPDDMTRARFRQRAAVAKQSFQGDILRHVAHESDTYAHGVMQGTLDTEARAIGANPQDDSAAGISAERVNAAIDAEGRRLGQTPDQIGVAKAKAIDHLWTSRLEAWRLVDPVGALKAFQDHIGEIGPDTRVKVAESLFHDSAPVLAAQLNEQGGPPVSASSLARESNLYAAKREMNLSEQEANIYRHHLGNLYGPGGVKNADGSLSTVYQAVVEHDGKFYNIPTVWNGKILPVEDAAKKASVAGWDKWPSYKSPEEADARYEKMHDYMERDTASVLQTQKQPRGIRNNNPGNIVQGPTQWEGQIEGADPRYASFASPEAGVRALGKNLLSYQAKGIDTVEQIIGRWAPASENPDVGDYVKTVAKKLGVDPREPLNLKDRKVLTTLATAIIEHENGQNPYSPETIAAGLDSAATGKSFAYEAKRSPGYAAASVANMTASEILGVVTGHAVIDRLPPDEKLAVFQLARTQGNQGMSQVREAMKQRLVDTSAAYERGLDAPNPPSRSELISVFGQFDGEKAAGDLDLSRTFGQDVRSVQNMPGTQQATLLAARAPVPGEGFAMAEKRHEGLARAVDAVQKERAQDPALAVMRNSPQVQNAYRTYAGAQGEGMTAAAQAYAAATLAEQQRLEVRNPQVLTKDMVDSIAKKFAEPPAQGENLANVMHGMVGQWGRYWPAVAQQLKGKIPPEAEVIGLGVSPEAEAALAEAVKLKPEALKQGIAEPDIKDLRERIRSAFEPLQRSVVWQSGGIETYNNFADSAEKIAIGMMQRGMKPKDAAAKAFESLAGFKYEFEDTWRVPKSALGGDTSVSTLRSGAEAVKRDIGSDKPVVGEKVSLLVPTAPGAVRPADAERQWRETIVSNGFWVTSPGDGGLTLYVKSGLGAQPVLDTQGQPIRRTWADISAVGNSVRAAYFRDVYKASPQSGPVRLP